MGNKRERARWEVGPRGKERNTFARLHVDGARDDAPKRFRSPDACASRTHRCIFLPEEHPIERNTWRCGCDGGVRPGPRFVSYRRGNEPSSGTQMLHATLFIVDKHARQRRLLFATGPRALRAPAFYNDGPGNLLGMLPGARVFWIINPFKYRLWSAGTPTYIRPF